MLEDNNATSTSTQQTALEKKILPSYQELDVLEADEVTEALRLLRTAHVSYLHNGLSKLPAGFAALDASRPWIVYWITHSLALLGADLPADGPTAADIATFLGHCQSPTGGFGGGPLQIAHLAPTYASVCALVTLGGEAVLRTINLPAMRDFLYRMVIPPEQGGGFRVHDGGEGDLRACFIVMAVAHMLGLDKEDLATRAGMVEYIKRCQTYEGGLGGEPGNEAHGGYTFCGLAALALIGREADLDLAALVHWAAQRQGSMEGGFNGRTNKLVDGCYSFWQGGLFPLLQRVAPEALRQAVLPEEEEAAGNYEEDDEDELPEVPPMPFIVPKTPVEQAGVVLHEKQAFAQQLINTALQAGDRADAALQLGTERATSSISTEARELLTRAGAAQSVAESAHLNVSIANCSAALLYPVPDAADPPFPATLVMPNMTTLHLGPPLYNYKALQLYILRCCQQLRGGLRDKPGKPADYYHTCYCLSGLSAAQHASNCALGPRENLLRRSDPMVNVVEDKLEAARRFFAANAQRAPAKQTSAVGMDVDA